MTIESKGNDDPAVRGAGTGDHRGSSLEVFRVFLKLGLSSFGGPIAHLGYYRNELVLRRRWIDEESYADLVALCQFLPGPASSQIGFSVGFLRANNLWGGIAAWIGFTLPSAVILVAFAVGSSSFQGPFAEGLLHGLKLVAVAIVAQALWGMAQTLTPDRTRVAIAVACLWTVMALPGSFGQVSAIAGGAITGLWLCRGTATALNGRLNFPVSRAQGAISLALFILLLLIPELLKSNQVMGLFSAFYRSGALVFGGGHVVLPLLQNAVVDSGIVRHGDFLAGYGLAQAIPGPLFSFASYLGAVAVHWPNGIAGAMIALVAIFLPGLLLVYGMLPYWDDLRSKPWAQAAMRGANAAVVGILGAALYNPVWTSAVMGSRDFALVVAAFLLLTIWKVPSWSIVALLAIGGTASAFL